MPDYITLLGAEQVERAARNMNGAADKMQRAADQIQFALEEHARREDQRDMDRVIREQEDTCARCDGRRWVPGKYPWRRDYPCPVCGPADG